MANQQYAFMEGEYTGFAPMAESNQAMARRSVSIFSRKGTETPEPKPPFIAQAAMPSPKKMNERQKSWIRSKSVSISPKKAKASGTILRAVPQASTIPAMSPLEEAMATSPNEEILTAISEHAPATAFENMDCTPTTATQASFWNRNTASLPQQSKSQRRREKESRIGTWVDGVAHWEPEMQQIRLNGPWEDSNLEGLTGFAPLRPNAYGGPAERTRPILSVVIPGACREVSDMTLSTIVQPRPMRPVVSVAPASIVSKYSISPPDVVFCEASRDFVSPMESASAAPTPPPQRSGVSPSLSVPQDSPATDERPGAPTRSSSSSSFVEKDDASVYSKRSSQTSVEAREAEVLVKSDDWNQLHVPKRAGSNAFSVANPADHGVFDEVININKPLPPSPIPFPRRTAPAPPSSPKSVKSASSSKVKSARSTKSAPGGTRTRTKVPTLMPQKSTKSLNQLDLFDEEFMRTSPYVSDMSTPSSPTLSEAEKDLETHLSTITEDSPQATPMEEKTEEVELVAPAVERSSSVRRSGSVRSVMQPPSRAPTLPKRSRKREWRASAAHPRHIAQLAMPSPVKQPVRRKSAPDMRQSILLDEDAPPVPIAHLRKTSSDAALRKVFEFAQLLRSSSMGNRDTIISPLPLPSIVIDDGLVVVEGPVIVRRHDSQAFNDAVASAVSTKAAESVLLDILSALIGLGDLFHTAMINKGMYRVYKENEMALIRMVNQNQSPPAWEFREWSPPESNNEVESSKASSQIEHSPSTYMRGHKRDAAVIESLKVLILEHCQSFLRRETAFAFSTPMHPNAQRFDDAFWRIWCFCKIFGCEKGREDDITGQLDWLKGGILANQQGCVATVNTNLDFDMSSVLLNAPEHFAKGNGSGLPAQQLYDMTEIWSCMSVLLQGYHGRVVQAREAGVYEGTDVADGDVEKEEAMLEEWTFHLLTLGPSVILEMAEYAYDESSAGFALAKENGWTTWTPPMYSGSRSTFLKEPVARLYEERVAAAALKLQNPRELEKKEMSRKRVATLAAEIRLRRQTSGYKRLPLIDMNSERPMSIMSRTGSTRSTTSTRSVSSTRTLVNAPLRHASSSRPMSPGLWGHQRKISPIIEDRVETFNRMSLQNLGGLAENTAEVAVRKIVDMGFSAAQAKDALKVTDMGDGLRLDRAVDLLLRQR